MKLLPKLLIPLLLSSSPAPATILFASGEDTGFNLIVGGSGGAAGESSGYASRSGYARNTTTTVAAYNATNVADPPASRIQTPTFTSVSSLWIHFQFETLDVNTTTTGQQALILRSPDGVARILLRQTGTTGQLKISKRNAAGTITDLVTLTGTFSNTTLTAFDMQVVYGCTTGDSVTVYYNSTSAGSATGASICTDSATQLNQMELGSFHSDASGSVSNAGTGYSEVIISSTDTRGMALWTLNPQAAGNTQSWTPNTVADINKAVINDATSISASTSSSVSQWTTPTTAPSGSWGVLGIVQEARMQVGTTGPQTFEWSCRSGGTDNVTGSLSPTTSYANFSNQIWANNCTTSSAWAISDIASGFNLGVESTP